MTMTTENPSEHAEPIETLERARSSRRRCCRVLRWIEHVLAGAAALLILFMVSPLPQRLYDSLDRQGELHPSKYIIVLGGDPSRIIEGVRLLKEGYGEWLVLSNNEIGGPMMRELAIEWGAPPEKIFVDNRARRTADHPRTVQRQCGLDPANDTCIVVTSYTHLARSKACFEEFGYRHVTMDEPEWERRFRPSGGWRNNYYYTPHLIYEYAAWVEYWLRGWV